MLRTRRHIARALAAALTATALVLTASPAASASRDAEAPGPTNCNVNSWVMTFSGGYYTTAELGYSGNLNGMLRGRATNPGPWENFQICTRYEGATKVSWLRNERNSRYVTAEFGRTGVDKGMLRARATSVGPWERFTISRWGPNPTMYTIKSLQTGQYVTTEFGYGGVRNKMLRARATSIGTWEKYLILCGAPSVCYF